MSKVKTRRATEADRKAALDALERANIPANDVATEVDTHPEKWTLKHCRAAMLKAGMTDEDIDAVFAANDPATSEGQETQHEEAAPGASQGPSVLIALTITAFSEDGEKAHVQDENGNQWELATTDFTHDQDSLSAGDTLPCYVLQSALPTDYLLACEPQDGSFIPADAAPAPHGDSEGNAPDLLSNPHNVRKLGRETIEVEQELTKDERLEVGARMAKALADRDLLELEFAGVKKDYKAKIDLAVSEAAEAGAEFRAGKRKLSVRAVKLEDRTTMEIVFVEPDGAQRELMRRPMTHEERKLPLPLQQDDQSATPPTIGTTEPTPDNARTCINCANMAQGDAEMPEPCQTCSQCGNGVADNWEAKRLCATCTDCTTRVNLYPCNGCSINADAEHRGDEDRWTWKESAPELTADATDEQLAATDETAGMSTAEEDTPTQGVAHGEDDMPTGDDTAADDMPDMPTVQPAEDMPTVRQ